MDWFRKQVSPRLRDTDNQKEVEEAREKAKESGQASVFEYEDVNATNPGGDASASPSAKALAKKKANEHRAQTAVFSISHRKLGKLAEQIAGKPVDSAILQMMFSEKRASSRIKSMLAHAKVNAISRGLEEEKLVISEAWVNKGPGGAMAKRLEIKGRSKMGIRKKYKAKMVVMLREGLTVEEKKAKDREVKLRRIVSAGFVREDIPIRNPSSTWAW